ncbi:uncharacterized protein LOC111997336 [Quercus suber]|uniref:uncharacterized protein LOC111997336 n=1 Tax=Quercus suber TaxID=58331 RepID=UPI000CE20261|nr:uncharacterized protein LOC111997336 [Quercus suber]POE69863.1 hypothetical protein CFP56_29447 [Quercus suber]
MQESAMRPTKEDDELQRSTKKVKEYSWDRGSLEPSSPSSSGEGRSYKAKLIGEIPGTYEQAFVFKSEMETEVVSDNKEEDLPLGEVVVRLFGGRKTKIRATWNNALIVKAFEKTVAYHYLISKLSNLWRPVGKMDCIALGQDFFLVRFSLKDDHSRVLKNGPWFVGGHYLSIRRWEPNFKPSSTNLSVVAIWIRLPKFPIEYYEELVLRDIGKAIGPVIWVDTHTALEAGGSLRGCVCKSISMSL